VKSANIFFKKGESKRDSYEPYFIDWQYIACGKGVQDIVFFIIESLNSDTACSWGELLKTYYYLKLRENGVVDYDISEYDKDFCAAVCYFPFFVCMWFGTTPDEDLIDKNFPFFFIQKYTRFADLHHDALILFLDTLT
jgi:hypothetical protein